MMKSSGPVLAGESRPEARGAWAAAPRIQVRRAIRVLTYVGVVCASAVVLQTHAADEPGRAVAQAVKPVAAAKPPASAKPPAPGAPQVPEESATIRDDPTIAPDPKQSADNNVSFPNDI